MRITALILTCVFLASLGAAETITLTRERTVALALERNETYKSVLLEKDRVRGQYLEARAGAFPRLTLEGTYLRNIDLQSSVLTMSGEDGSSEKLTLRFGTPHNYSFGLNLYQPLYAAGKVGAAIKIARYGFAYTDEAIRTARHDVATGADRAYLAAVAARDAAEVYGEAERLADSNLAVVRRLYEQGETSEYDLLRAQVQAANSRPGRIAAENNARLALDQLRNLLAMPPETKLELQRTIAEVAVPALALDALIAEAEQNRPELHQSEQMININEKLIGIARSGYKPTIGVSSRVQWDSFQDDISKTSMSGSAWNRSWNVAVMLSWPIFTGFETTGKIRQAKVDYNQSRLDNSQLRRQVRLEVRDALGKVNEARQRVEALAETVAQAERGVDISRIRFENGLGTQLELMDAQVALTTVRVNRISALHDLALAVSQLRRAVGREWASQW